MKTAALILPVAALLVACASTQPQPAGAAAPGSPGTESAARRCDQTVTGSRIPRCDRSDVRVITREEIERTGMPGGTGTPAGGAIQ
jgi:hypothetical protein